MTVKSYRLDTKHNIQLKDFTSFKIGGRARDFIVIHSIEDLRFVIETLALSKGGFYLLGSGSNLLITDTEIIKPVVKLGKEFNYIKKLHDDIIEVGSATPLSSVISYALGEKLSGIENLVAIPASVGGLVAMNASSFGKDFSSCLQQVTAFDSKGCLVCLNREDINFGYRYSSLKNHIVLGVRIKLQKDINVKDNLINYLGKRLDSQDFLYPSAGCIFKNPHKLNAAFLIEHCGLKRFMINDARVSDKHANFIVNRNKAKALDVVSLIDIIKERVYLKFGVILEEEIIRWDI